MPPSCSSLMPRTNGNTIADTGLRVLRSCGSARLRRCALPSRVSCAACQGLEHWARLEPAIFDQSDSLTIRPFGEKRAGFVNDSRHPGSCESEERGFSGYGMVCASTCNVSPLSLLFFALSKGVPKRQLSRLAARPWLVTGATLDFRAFRRRWSDPPTCRCSNASSHVET